MSVVSHTLNLLEEALQDTTAPATSPATVSFQLPLFFRTPENDSAVAPAVKSFVPDSVLPAVRLELKASLDALQERLDEIERALKVPGVCADVSADPWIDQAYRELISAGMDTATARGILENTSKAWRGLSTAQRLQGVAFFRKTLVESIVSQLKFAELPQYGLAEFSPKLVFAGPAGAGKSTTLTKIAIQEFRSRGIPVRILSVDPHHTPNHDRMRTLASMIGANFAAANTLREFEDALRNFPGRGPLLIDTPGYTTETEANRMRELANCLSEAGPKQTHLVLPAWMAKQNLISLFRQYEAFSPDALLFTQLDETESYGALVSTALEVKRPLSFFASGQSIPEDITPASPRTLFEALFHGRRIETAPAQPAADRGING